MTTLAACVCIFVLNYHGLNALTDMSILPLPYHFVTTGHIRMLIIVTMGIYLYR